MLERDTYRCRAGGECGPGAGSGDGQQELVTDVDESEQEFTAADGGARDADSVDTVDGDWTDDSPSSDDDDIDAHVRDAIAALRALEQAL